MKRVKILVVEDEVIIALELKNSLENLGYTVTSAISKGEEAVKRAETEKPDIIVMDIRLKGKIDGIEAAEIIRSKFSIPIVFSTAHLDEERLERAKIAMPFGYLLKPIQERELKVTLEMALYVAEMDAIRRQMEQDLKISEARFKELFNGMSSGVAVYHTSNNGENFVFVDFNRAGERIDKLKKENLIGRCVSEVFPSIKEFGLFDVLKRVWQTGKSEHHPTSYYKDDRLVGWRENFVYKLPTDEIVAIYEDITERKLTEDALRQIEWLAVKPGQTESPTQDYEADYGDLAALNQCRILLDSIGKDLLMDIATDFLDLLESSAAVYEKNGDYALGIYTSGWCRFLDRASRDLCRTKDNAEALNCGKWLCHESCWNGASRAAIASGKPNEVECHGGIRIYAHPIFAGDEVVGAINFSYGSPPKEAEKLEEIARKYQVDTRELGEYAVAYETRPLFLIENAKKRLATSARLIGTFVLKDLAGRQ